MKEREIRSKLPFYFILLNISAKFMFIKKKPLYLYNSIKIGSKNLKEITVLKIFLLLRNMKVGKSKYYATIYQEDHLNYFDLLFVSHLKGTQKTSTFPLHSCNVPYSPHRLTRYLNDKLFMVSEKQKTSKCQFLCQF